MVFNLNAFLRKESAFSFDFIMFLSGQEKQYLSLKAAFEDFMLAFQSDPNSVQDVQIKDKLNGHEYKILNGDLWRFQQGKPVQKVLSLSSDKIRNRVQNVEISEEMHDPFWRKRTGLMPQ